MALIDIKKLKDEATKLLAKAKEVVEDLDVKGSVANLAAQAKEKADEMGVSEAVEKAREWKGHVQKDAIEWTSQAVKDASEWTSLAAKDASEWTSQAAKDASEWASQALSDSSEWVSKTAKNTVAWTISSVHVVGNKFEALKNDEQVIAVWQNTAELAGKVGQSSLKGLKVISGVQAVHDRKKSIQTKEEADALEAEVLATNEAVREDMNNTLEEFGKRRLEALHNTVGCFLDYLERINQHAKVKEYEFLTEIDLKQEEVAELKQIDMKASEAAKVLAVGGGFATVGLMGTPALVTGMVTSFAAASTGTAISSLTGAAATNAVLAWLGGGAVAAGGGGVAAGTAVMAALTATATVGLAVIAVGTLASTYYSRKFTEATEHLAEIQEWVAQTQTSWTVMAGIKQRVIELQGLTSDLEQRTIAQLHKLDPYIGNFNNNDMSQVKLFQQAAIMVKSMSELAQVPILDEEGNLNEQACIVATKTEKVLNTSI